MTSPRCLAITGTPTKWAHLPRLGIVAAIVVAAALAIAWAAGLFPQRRGSAPANALIVIAPYRHAGIWIFDDPSAGLLREPFVAGVPEMIDVLVRDIPGATNGFRLMFSAQPFPGYQKKLTWLRGDMGGNYYQMDDPTMEGWICPAMFRYYQTAPRELYVKAEAKRGDTNGRTRSLERTAAPLRSSKVTGFGDALW